MVMECTSMTMETDFKGTFLRMTSEEEGNTFSMKEGSLNPSSTHIHLKYQK